MRKLNARREPDWRGSARAMLGAPTRNRTSRFAGWSGLVFFEHENCIHAITQESLDAAFEKAVGQISNGRQL